MQIMRITARKIFLKKIEVHFTETYLIPSRPNEEIRNQRVTECRLPGQDDRGVVDTRPGERTHFEDG
jgi:hypothetical protein